MLEVVRTDYGYAQRALFIWLTLAQVGPGGDFGVGEAFNIRELVSELKQILRVRQLISGFRVLG